LLYSHVIDDALEEKIGKAGLPRAVLDRELARLRPVLDKLRAWHDDNTLPLLRLRPAANCGASTPSTSRPSRNPRSSRASIFPRGGSRRLRPP
jgi:hypothetical protein